MFSRILRFVNKVHFQQAAKQRPELSPRRGFASLGNLALKNEREADTLQTKILCIILFSSIAASFESRDTNFLA